MLEILFFIFLQSLRNIRILAHWPLENKTGLLVTGPKVVTCWPISCYLTCHACVISYISSHSSKNKLSSRLGHFPSVVQLPQEQRSYKCGSLGHTHPMMPHCLSQGKPVCYSYLVPHCHGKGVPVDLNEYAYSSPATNSSVFNNFKRFLIEAKHRHRP